MAKQLERLERTFRACTCERPQRSPPNPSPRFERSHFLSSGCHLQQEIALEAFHAALEAGALGAPGLEDIPDFILCSKIAQHHLSSLLQDLVFDPDSGWAESCGGKGCTLEVVRALLACGVGATIHSVFLPVWQDNVAHPYSLAAFAISEALEAVLRRRAAEATVRAAAEKWIGIALALLESDSPVDAPEAVAVWGQRKAKGGGGGGASSVIAMQTALYCGGPAAMRREAPCASLCVAGVLAAWATEKAGRAPLEGAAELLARVAGETPPLLTACPRCEAALPARPPPAAALAGLFPSLLPFPVPFSAASPLQPWDLASAPAMRALEDFVSFDSALTAPEARLFLESRHALPQGFCALRAALLRMFMDAIKAGGALLPWQDENEGSGVSVPAPGRSAPPPHRVCQVFATRSAQRSVIVRIVRLLRVPDAPPVLLVAWGLRPVVLPSSFAAWQRSGGPELVRLVSMQPMTASVSCTYDAGSDGVRMLVDVLSASSAAAGSQLEAAYPDAGLIARSCGGFARLALLPLLYPVVHNPPFALGAPQPGFSFESEEAQLAGMACADPPQWQAVRTLAALKQLAPTMPLFRTAYCKDKAALLRGLPRLHAQTQAQVQASCERAGVWDGGAELPPEWAGSPLPAVERRSVAPAAAPDGASHVQVVRITPSADGRGVDVLRSTTEAGAASGGGGGGVHRLCSAETCGLALPADAPLKCGACSRVFYCGRDCQRADWRARHKVVCPQLQAETAAVAAAVQRAGSAAATATAASRVASSSAPPEEGPG